MPEVASYDIQEAPASEQEPGYFMLGGERFDLRDAPPPMAFFEYAKASADGLKAETVEGWASILRFYEGALPPDDYARFVRLCRAKAVDGTVITDIIGDVTKWWAAGRPTQSSSDSSVPAGTADTSSGGDSSAKASSASKPRKRRAS